MDILKLSQLPESNSLEFKRDSSSLDSILKSVIAFANTLGGIILIGVEDNGAIIGINNPNEVQEQVANSIAHRIKPQLVPEIHIDQVDGKSILVIQVDYIPGPYYLADKGEERGVYIRLGSTNRLAGNEKVMELKRAHSHPYYDGEPCDHVTEEDLDQALIKKTFSNRRSVDTAKLLGVGILTKKGRQIVASNAGVILFGKPDIRKEHFPFAEVRCARFSGSTKAEFIDRLEIEGSILAAIDEVPKFIRRNTKMAGKFGGMKRRDIPEYPVKGIREALTNAIAHANYEIGGSRIFVAIYDDKLEIQNPGIMPPGMDIEQFKAGVSRVRNPVIARVFGELGLVEEWGSGYERIKNACQSEGYPEPIWEELGTALRVTFFPHPEITAQSKIESAPSWHQVGTKLASSQHQVDSLFSLDKESIKLLKYCKISRSLQEMMELLGWQDRTKFSRKFIHPFLENRLLERTIPEKPNSSLQRYRTSSIWLDGLKKKKISN